MYQPVRIKGYLSLGVSICRVYFSARELLRRNFQRGRARGISRMECPAFGISLSFFLFFLLGTSNYAPFPRETNHSIYALPNRFLWSVFIGHSKIRLLGFPSFELKLVFRFDVFMRYLLVLFAKKITDISANKMRHYQIFNYKKIESFEIFQTFSADLFKIISSMLIISLRIVVVFSRVGERNLEIFFIDY